MSFIQEFLLREREVMPTWITHFSPEDSFDLNAFWSSRRACYFGHGEDLHAIQVFGLSSSAHCFIQGGFGLDERALLNRLQDEGVRFPPVDDSTERLEWTKKQDLPAREIHSILTGQPWAQEIAFHPISVTDLTHEIRSRWPALFSPENLNPEDQSSFFAAGVVLEQTNPAPWVGQQYPQRIAVLFLRADGIRMDKLLFGAGEKHGPYALLIEEFVGEMQGHPSLLETAAQENHLMPPWLFVADNTFPWQGYTSVTFGELGNVSAHQRSLFQLNIISQDFR